MAHGTADHGMVARLLDLAIQKRASEAGETYTAAYTALKATRRDLFEAYAAGRGMTLTQFGIEIEKTKR